MVLFSLKAACHGPVNLFTLFYSDSMSPGFPTFCSLKRLDPVS
jgi:hypothetical protein